MKDKKNFGKTSKKSNKKDGRIFGDKYHEIEKIHNGVFANVYRVKVDGRDFILKESNTKEDRGKFTRNQHCGRTGSHFMAEKEIMEKIKDMKGIVPIKEIPQEGMWYVMEECLDSYDYVIKEDLTIEEVIDHFINLTETLVNLHKKGIFHRDIKPKNILIHNRAFVLCDFGIAHDSQQSQIKENNSERIGADLTMAPEMRRNAASADYEKADVYSLAKTLWMFLARNTKGFAGKYDFWKDEKGLGGVAQQKRSIVSIAKLISEATDNEPDVRPSMETVLTRLKKWRDSSNNLNYTASTTWDFLAESLMGRVPSQRIVWENREEIVRVLKMLSKLCYNHIFMPGGGGTDILDAGIGAEPGSITIDDGQTLIVKPKALYLECFGDHDNSKTNQSDKVALHNYFFLECVQSNPIIDSSESDSYSEELVEDTPGHYVSANRVAYGQYDNKEETPLPVGWRYVMRFYRGNFLIVSKNSFYNSVNGTYDGRHNTVDPNRFRDFMECFLQHKGERHDLKSIQIFEECSQKILGTRSLQEICGIATHSVEEEESIVREITQKLCFKDKLPLQQRAGRIEFTFEWIDRICSFNKEQYKYLCDDGKFHYPENNTPLFHLYDRAQAIELMANIERIVEAKFKKEQVTPPFFRFKLKKIKNPCHVPTSEEIRKAILNADDSIGNVMVIDEFGYVEVVPNHSIKRSSYPVQLEPWSPCLNYTGKYTNCDDKRLKILRKMCLQGLKTYVETGEVQHELLQKSGQASELEAYLKKVMTVQKPRSSPHQRG